MQAACQGQATCSIAASRRVFGDPCSGTYKYLTINYNCGTVGTPTKSPTKTPTKSPTKSPTKTPTKSPTKSPTAPPAIGYFDRGTIARCDRNTEVSKTACLAAALEVNENVSPHLYIHTGGGFPCGCSIYNPNYAYYKDPDNGNCKENLFASVVCQETPTKTPTNLII